MKNMLIRCLILLLHNIFVNLINTIIVKLLLQNEGNKNYLCTIKNFDNLKSDGILDF